MVRRLVEQQHIGGRHELAREPDAPALAAAQCVERSGSRLRGIEAESLQHGVDARGDRVAALALEALEVAPVARQLLPRSSSRIAERVGLLGERLLEREQLGERARRGLPDRRASPKSRCCPSSETRSARLPRDRRRASAAAHR